MSDREEPGREAAPEQGGKRIDARERLRKRLEGMLPPEFGTPDADEEASKVIRLPRRPRRVGDEAAEHPDPWHPDGSSVYDPAPTRPVLRSELQRETGWWPVDPGAIRHPAAPFDPDGGEHDGSVVDLDALRRQRAEGDNSVRGRRRMARPRRISKDTDEIPAADGEHDNGPDFPRH
ncbi:hypothetical protein AB0H76_19190 [Nocardia sp. NPDC050712]|uniref:hypothetical protein n=1 Tax=Nocardia sp. NPDC050712 TaxID=3155518 RepID=UPI0033C539F7